MLILDSNILVSYSLNKKSHLGRTVKTILAKHAYACSAATFNELTAVLLREKFDRYFLRSSRAEMLRNIATGADWFTPTQTIRGCRDPKDNKFLELAVAAEAEFLITGDEDLLILDPFRKTRILTIADFTLI